MPLSAEDSRVWNARIAHALALQQTQHRRWEEAQWFVEGTWFEKKGFLDPDATPVNYAVAYVKTVVAAVYARNPKILVKPRHSRFAGFARSQQLVLNYLWRELALKQQMKRAIVDGLITGLGWIDVGFTADFAQIPTEPSAQLDGVLTRLLGEDGRPEEQGVLNEYLRAYSAYALRVSPWKVLLAPGYHDIHAMPYLITLEDIAPEDLARHPRYQGLDVGDPTRTVSSGDTLITRPKPGKTTNQPEPLMLHRAFHVWDRRNQRQLDLLEGTLDAPDPQPWPYSFDGFPQVPLAFFELPETERDTNCYPMSEITPMIPQLREQCWGRTAMVRHRRRSGTLLIVRKGALTSEQKALIQSGDDVRIVEADDPTGIVPHSPPELPEDVYRTDAIIRGDLDLVSGFSAFLPSQITGKDKTATELNLRAQGTSFLSSEKVDVIETASAQVARRLAAIAWEYYGRDRIREILGELMLPEALWPSLPEDREERRAMIQEELQVEIEAGSTQPIKDKTVLREQKLRLANILMATAPERIKKGPLIQQLLDDFEFTEAGAFVLLEDEQEQQVALRENALLEQNIPQEVGPNELHDVHMNVHAQGLPSPAKDAHLLAHNQQMLLKQPNRTPQQGDEMPAGGAGAPEQLRQGVPSFEDLSGAAGQALSQPAEERGGLPNV